MSRRSVAWLVAGLGLIAPASGQAATYTVNPTRVYLSASSASALMTLRNESAEPLRMQIKAQRWTQGAQGDMQLAPTDDLIVFPNLLTLAPGEQRRVRVATTVEAGPIERSYRLYVEELPASASDRADGAAVRFLTRMGIPVFVQPARPAATATVRGVGLKDRRVSFELANTGNTHFMPTAITVRGFTATGTPVADWPVSGWYVLAGSARTFAVGLDRPACETVRSVLIEVAIGETVLKAPLTTPGGACPD